MAGSRQLAAGGWQQVAGSRRGLAAGRWRQVAGNKWLAAGGGRQQVAGEARSRWQSYSRLD
jgi:uncharacterized protein YjbJ (UPF0337 family)